MDRVEVTGDGREVTIKVTETPGPGRAKRVRTFRLTWEQSAELLEGLEALKWTHEDAEHGGY